MTKRSSLTSLTIVLALVLSGCASKVEEKAVPISAPEKMYQQAQESLTDQGHRASSFLVWVDSACV